MAVIIVSGIHFAIITIFVEIIDIATALFSAIAGIAGYVLAVRQAEVNVVAELLVGPLVARAAAYHDIIVAAPVLRCSICVPHTIILYFVHIYSSIIAVMPVVT